MTCILSFSVFNIAALMVSNVNNNNNNNNINDNQDNINDNNINESNTNADVMSMVMVGLGGRGLNVTKRSTDMVLTFSKDPAAGIVIESEFVRSLI